MDAVTSIGGDWVSGERRLMRVVVLKCAAAGSADAAPTMDVMTLPPVVLMPLRAPLMLVVVVVGLLQVEVPRPQMCCP